jgi:hypothetical protein
MISEFGNVDITCGILIWPFIDVFRFWGTFPIAMSSWLKIHNSKIHKEQSSFANRIIGWCLQRRNMPIHTKFLFSMREVDCR